MSEPIKIEPYYQARAKRIVDAIFDPGLSRDGMDAVEGLLALHLQRGAESATRREAMPRHEEEMGWIARAREAEARVAKLEAYLPREEKANKAWGWGKEVAIFLKTALLQKPGHSFDLNGGRRLLERAQELGIIPEPDCRPGKIVCKICHQPFDGFHSNRCPGREPIPGPELQKSGDGCPCPPEAVCPKCGGRKLT